MIPVINNHSRKNMKIMGNNKNGIAHNNKQDKNNEPKDKYSDEYALQES